MPYKYLVFLLAASLPFSIMAQEARRCASSEYTVSQEKKNPGLARIREASRKKILNEIEKRGFNKTEATILVPVVVHVLYNTSVQNISDAQINSQIDVLNEDFGRKNPDANKTPDVWQGTAGASQIQFTLAKRDPKGNPTTGIIRKQTAKTYFDVDADDEKFSSRGGDDIWDHNMYLNIWVVPLIKNSSNDVVLGFAQHPNGPAASDGVTIGYKYFGRTGTLSSTYNKGRTATHEIGHWFDLEHIWGDDGGGCDGSDGINDTPNQASDNSGIPVFPEKDDCSPDYPGIMFMNYMDYTDDAGMNMFTQDQVGRMEVVLNQYRSGLKTSIGATVGVNEVMQDNIKVFPNPFKNTLNIDVPQTSGFVTVAVYDVIGNCVLNTTYDSTKGQTAFVDLSDHSSGCYFVRIGIGSRLFVKKVMLVRD